MGTPTAALLCPFQPAFVAYCHRTNGDGTPAMAGLWRCTFNNESLLIDNEMGPLKAGWTVRSGEWR